MSRSHFAVDDHHHLSPFAGVGVAQILFSLATLGYLAIYLGWLLLFLFYLFWTVAENKPGLPWLDCDGFPQFNTQTCLNASDVSNFTQTPMLSVNDSRSSLSQFILSVMFTSVVGRVDCDCGAFQDSAKAEQGHYGYWPLSMAAAGGSRTGLDSRLLRHFRGRPLAGKGAAVMFCPFMH